MASKAVRERVEMWKGVRGRNGFDVATDLPDDMAAELLNTLISRGTIGQKRNGSVAQAFTGDTFSGYNATARYVPGQSDAAAQLHWMDRTATTKAMKVAGGTVAAELTLKDAVTTRPQDATYANLNGKLYIAYDSAVNRLSVYDPQTSTTAIRRVGLPSPGAPAVANTGSGTYAATIRYYRTNWRVYVSGAKQRQSNFGTTATFTPSGSGVSARITQPTAAGEGETHWVVAGSADNLTFYELAEIVIGTTTYDDSLAPSSYSDGTHTPTPEEGAFTPWPSVKYLAQAGDRLLGYGAWETAAGSAMTPYPGRVWFSPVLSSSDYDDDERVSNSITFKGYIDFKRNAGAEDRAICGPIDDSFLVFASRGIGQLIPTGSGTKPYRRIYLHPTLGAVSQWSTFMGEDEQGRPACYFLEPERGPYRYGARGFEWCGYDVQDLWATFNPAAANRTAHGVWDSELRMAIWSIATGSSDDPDTIIAFSAREGTSTGDEGVRYGWMRWSGGLASSRCSVMFAKTFGATMSRSLKPYFGFASALLRGDDAAATDDNGTPFQSYALSKAWCEDPRMITKMTSAAYVQAKTSAGVTIQQSLIANFGTQTTVATALLTAVSDVAAETRVLPKFQDTALTDAWCFQVQLGDASAQAVAWTLDAWFCPVERNEEL